MHVGSHAVCRRNLKGIYLFKPVFARRYPARRRRATGSSPLFPRARHALAPQLPPCGRGSNAGSPVSYKNAGQAPASSALLRTPQGRIRIYWNVLAMHWTIASALCPWWIRIQTRTPPRPVTRNDTPAPFSADERIAEPLRASPHERPSSAASHRWGASTAPPQVVALRPLAASHDAARCATAEGSVVVRICNTRLWKLLIVNSSTSSANW